MPIDPTQNVVFVPADPPRDGVLAILGSGPDQIELVIPTGSTVRRRVVPARRVPLAVALPEMLAIDREQASSTLAAWAAAATVGVQLVSRGRLLPSITGGGYDAWRAGPLDASDERWLRELSAAFPPLAHALPVVGARPLRLRSAGALIRELWDAVADILVRTSAAARASGGAAFAASAATDVGDLREWLAETDRGLDAGARLGLRLEADEVEDEAIASDADGTLRAVLQLRSSADPSLVVDVGDLWDAPTIVLARLGPQAETDLLLALRRGAQAWPPLSPVLRAAAPIDLPLDDDALADLLGPGSEALAGAGIEVLWPADLLVDGLQLRAVVATPAPESVTAAGLTLDALLEFRWQLTLGDAVLTDAEVTALAEAKRPLVRLRGRWVTVDQELLARLRNRRKLRISTGEALSAALTGQLEVGGEAVAFHASGALAGLVERLATLSDAPPLLDPPPGLRGTLRPYQARGLAWLAQMTQLGLGGCLADDMGLGKTIQLIALHLHRQGSPSTAAPTLVVCPTSLLGNWERELRRFAPGVPVRRFHGGGRHLEQLVPAEVVLVTYGVVRRDRESLAEVAWGLVVADEAQHVKNPLSRTARELRALPAQARVALTGTPVENRLSELWALLNWTTPGLLGTLPDFQRRVAAPVERYHDPDATERLSRLVRPFLLRRRKADPGIAPELPAKTETDRIVPLTSEQATLYEAVVRESIATIRESAGIARRGLVLKLLTALKQICNHPAQYLGQRAPLAGRSGKLAALDELLEVILSEGESVLVFTQYVAMARLLETHLAASGTPTLLLHGGVPVAAREDMVSRFQNGVAPVFLLSLKAGGVGLNLTRATHVVHYDRWWNPAVEDQATDRAYRIGQDRPVQVHRLIAEGTLEDRIALLLESKRALADAVVGSGEGWLSELSDGELTELVRLGGSG